ncbi:MAG TPA: translation initiation factor IF-2, partial [Limnochordia bacterium]|nr:translation initiation factor IF-2 [Limnochordia bacterium]
IIAVNKMDRPGANPDRVKQQLTEHELVPEEWGGDTICVNVSAVQKQGIEELLEMILLVAEMRELTANPNRAAKGAIVEAELDRSRGPVATVLVQNGTLRVGDSIVAGSVAGKVRAMFSETGAPVTEAGPSTPVEVLGLSDVPEAGDILEAVSDDKTARDIADRRATNRKETQFLRGNRLRLGELFTKSQKGEVKDLNLVIKADVQGSVEALRGSLEKLSNDEVHVNFIHVGAGAITESDVHLAAASEGIIIGFNVRPETSARRAAEREGVDIRLYSIIYEAIDDVRLAMSGMLDPEFKEAVLGQAEVRQIFRVSGVGTVAGCYVREGKLVRNAKVRVLRDNVVIHEGVLASLKRFKDDAREVAEGFECGCSLEKFHDLKEGDVIEGYEMREIERGA